MSKKKIEIVGGALIWPSPETRTLDAALFYARKLGWRVLPVERDGKAPILRKWPENASKDPGQIQEWFGEHSKTWSANIGIACGRESGIAVVDVDVKPLDGADGATGLDNLTELVAIHGKTGVTLRGHTPSGGRHLIFRWASLPFGSSAGTICAGVDLRSARPDGKGAGQIVVAPSSIRDRETLLLLCYEWKRTIDSLDQLSDAPEWLAIRACFNEGERNAIEACAGFRKLLVSEPRADWRGLFDEWRVAEKRERAAAQASTSNTRIGGSVHSTDHPYVRSAIDQELQSVRSNDQAGTQNKRLHIAALKIGSLLAAIGQTDADTIAGAKEQLMEAAAEMPNLDMGRPWNSSDGERAALKTIESGLKFGLENPRDLSGVKAIGTAVTRFEYSTNHVVNAEPKPDQTVEMEDGIVLQCFSDIELRPISWLWDKHLVRGNLNVMAGNASQGKSTIMCDLAMRVTTGAPWPSQYAASAQRREPGKVLIVNDEDVAADTIGPRLKAAGADMSRVFQVQSVWRKDKDGKTKEGVLSLIDDVPRIEQQLRKLGDVQLIVVDPINSYLNGVDSHNNAEMRGALTPLKRVAEKFNVAVLIVAHLNKNADGPAMNRVSGSLALVAASRAAFMVGVDPNDSSRRVLVPAKQNLTKPTSALAFRTVSADVETSSGITNVSRIEWLGCVEGVTPEDVLKATGDQKRTAVDDAVEWLTAYMKPGKRYDAEDIKAKAKAEMITSATLRRAKDKLFIRTDPRRD